MIRDKERKLTLDGIARGWTYKRGEGVKVKALGIRANMSMKGVSKTKERMMILDYRISRMWGQKGAKVKAEKSVAEFNIREGGDIGEKVTLRDERGIEAGYKMIVLIARPRLTMSTQSGKGAGKPKPGYVEQRNSNSRVIFPEKQSIIEGLPESYGQTTDWTFASVLESRSTTSLELNIAGETSIVDIRGLAEKIREIKLTKEGMSWEFIVKAPIEAGSRGKTIKVDKRTVGQYIRQYMKI